jgi:SAM-dependent methyltransferase
MFETFPVALAGPTGTRPGCAALEELGQDGTDLGDNQAVFNSDVYGGRAYERGVMAYGSPETGGGWWAVQHRIQSIVETELRRKQAEGASQVAILDVGSGPGFTLNEIRRVADRCCPTTNVRAQGIEYNEKMVSYSRTTYGVDVRQGDMHELSGVVPAASIDIVNAQSVLWTSNTPRKVAGEIAKVQKPGGIVTFTWPVRRQQRGSYDNYVSWFSAFSKDIESSVRAGRLSRQEADGVLEAHRHLVLGNRMNSPRDPEEVIELFAREGYVLEERTPQYFDEHGQPFFYQYTFRKTR